MFVYVLVICFKKKLQVKSQVKANFYINGRGPYICLNSNTKTLFRRLKEVLHSLI